MENLRYLGYTSRVNAPMDHMHLRRLVETSRSNNERQEITGLLVFDGNSFFQWIEGPEQAIDSLWRRIQWDPRHTHLRLVAMGSAHERFFTEWSLAFRGTGLPCTFTPQEQADLPLPELNTMYKNPRRMLAVMQRHSQLILQRALDDLIL